MTVSVRVGHPDRIRLVLDGPGQQVSVQGGHTQTEVFLSLNAATQLAADLLWAVEHCDARTEVEPPP